MRVGLKTSGHAKGEKQRYACQVESIPDTQKEKNRNLRVGSKTSGHAKQEKQESACQRGKMKGIYCANNSTDCAIPWVKYYDSMKTKDEGRKNKGRYDKRRRA